MALFLNARYSHLKELLDREIRTFALPPRKMKCGKIIGGWSRRSDSIL